MNFNSLFDILNLFKTVNIFKSVEMFEYFSSSLASLSVISSTIFEVSFIWNAE